MDLATTVAISLDKSLHFEVLKYQVLPIYSTRADLALVNMSRVDSATADMARADLARADMTRAHLPRANSVKTTSVRESPQSATSLPGRLIFFLINLV